MHFLCLVILACIAFADAQICGRQVNGITFAINVTDLMPGASNRSITAVVTVATALAANDSNTVAIHDRSVFVTTTDGNAPPSSLIVRTPAAASVVLTPTAFAGFTAGPSASIISVPLVGAASAGGATEIAVRLASATGGVRKDFVSAGFASDSVGGQLTDETWNVTLTKRVPTVKFKSIAAVFSSRIWLASSQIVTIVCPASYLVGIHGVMYAGTTNMSATTTAATDTTANCVTIADGSSTAVADTLGGIIANSASTGSNVSTTMDLPGGHPALGLGDKVTGASMIIPDVDRIPEMSSSASNVPANVLFSTFDSTKICFSSPQICSTSTPFSFKVEFEGNEVKIGYCNDCKSQCSNLYLDVTLSILLPCIPNSIPGTSATKTKVSVLLQSFVVSSTAANPTITCAPCSSAYFLAMTGSASQMAIAASLTPNISGGFVSVRVEYAASIIAEFNVSVFARTKAHDVPSESVPASCDRGGTFSVSVDQFVSSRQCSAYLVRNLQQTGCLDADTLVAASHHRDCISCSTGKLLHSIPTCTSGAGNVCVFEKPSEGSQLYSDSTKYFDLPPTAICSLFPSSGSASGFSVSVPVTIIPASMTASSKLISAFDASVKHELTHISRTSSKGHCWFAVILMIGCAAYLVVWCTSTELAFFHSHFSVTIVVTKPRRRPRTVIQSSRAFDGCVAHLKFAFSVLRLAIESFCVLIAAAPKVIFYSSFISLKIGHRVWCSRLKQLRTSVQRWSSCAVFVGCISALPMHVQGYGGVRAP